jgi:ubiquinone/menaquinone biosynthesis C-methylase UbiE
MAYEGSGAAWACGPSFVYDRMALRVVQPHAPRLAGKLVLDAGAGTGAVCRALARAGALPVACDSSADMLAQVGDAALVAVVGDLCAQPFLDGAFGAAVSAFAISHVDTPERSLAELRRVVKPAGPVIVAVFAAAPRNANKNIVDQLAAEHGYVAPHWYVHLKTTAEPLSNTPSLLRACADEAGLDDIHIDDITIDSGIDSPEAMVEYRTGMAHLAPFVRSLPHVERELFVREAIAAVAQQSQGLAPRVLILSSRAPA